MRVPPALLVALSLLVLTAGANAAVPCKSEQLALTRDADTVDGTIVEHIALENISLTRCTLSGYPHLVALNDKGERVEVVKFQHSNPRPDEEKSLQKPVTVVLSTGDRAAFELSYADGTTLKPGVFPKYCVATNLSLRIDRAAELVRIGKAGPCSTIRVTSFSKSLPNESTKESARVAKALLRIAPCRADQLKPTFDGGTGMGHDLVSVFMKNVSRQSCTIKGYPNLVFFSKRGRITRHVEFRQDWPMGTELPPVVGNEKLVPPAATTVLLASGDEAEFEMYFANGTGVEDPDKTCTIVEYSELRLTPKKARLKLPERFQLCYGMDITSIRNAWTPVSERRSEEQQESPQRTAPRASLLAQ